jgi:wyosine [tRNA(Phe)-imidazoG37] synthetase (radical SAM superfamily)
MLMRGLNDDPKELAKLKAIVDDLSIDKIHLNTVTRPPAEKAAEALETVDLKKIQKVFGKRCEIICSFKKRGVRDQKEDWKLMVLGILRRRPLRADDIRKITGSSLVAINKGLRGMERDGEIKSYQVGQETYYTLGDQ